MRKMKRAIHFDFPNLPALPDVDGIFLDRFNNPAPCFGDECITNMKKEGVDI